jgi:hypothetical protein
MVGAQSVLGSGNGPLEPVGLGAGGASSATELAKLLGHGGEPRVGLVQPRQRGLDSSGRLAALAVGRGEGEAHPLAACGRLLQPRRHLVDGRLHLEQARGTRRAATRHCRT